MLSILFFFFSYLSSICFPDSRGLLSLISLFAPLLNSSRQGFPLLQWVSRPLVLTYITVITSSQF